MQNCCNPSGPDLQQTTGSMNLSAWRKSMYSTSDICHDGCATEHLTSFQPDPVPSNVDASGVSIHIDNNMKIPPESDYYSSNEDGSGLICPSRPELDPPRDGTSRLHSASPASSPHGHHDWSLSSGHQAKRARVENIIKGMTSSPGAHCSDVITNQNEETGYMQGNETICGEHMESGPSGTGHSQAAIKQLESQQQNLQQLRAKFNYVDEVSEATDSITKQEYPTYAEAPDASDAFTDTYNAFERSSSRKYQSWKKVKLMNYFQTKPERIKLMADVLKYELSRVVSRSVDSVFKSMPLLQASLNNEGNTDTDIPLQSIVCDDKKLRLSCCGNAEVPDVQTEALSLVVQKPRLDKLILQPRSRAHHPQAFSPDHALHEDSQPHQSAPHQHGLTCLQDRCSDVGQAKFEMFGTRWNSVKVRSKVNSRSMRSPQTHTMSVDSMLLESLCLPHVKIESDSLVKSNLYMLNEGLTTNHLKKAKLLFFYTRYPSSLVLKMCFHDVQFTHCITSQLIKWFSNFREFYYIQMEKFARHALMEGVADVRRLTVGRESELFRALNMHYNKANDFQVPDRFLEVAEITLREFYIAISMGKDRDPSWKKAIYKVICKMDSDIPAEFKSQHSG